MLLKVLLNYILGYVSIKVEGMFLERFINICVSKKIFLWGIKRKKATLLYANIGINDYKKIRTICKKTKSKVVIQSKKGLPFFLHKYRKRKVFIGLLIALLIALFIISNYIWNIEVQGNINITQEDILQSLNEEGLQVGKSKKSINLADIINKIRLKRDDIAWIGIEITGTNAKVAIKETDKAPEIIDKAKPCNIISNKVGMITKMNVQEGTAIAKVGDIVKENNLLVAGHIEGKYTDTRYVHSMAEIEAKIWYSKKERAYIHQEIATDTGNTETKYSISVKNFRINFYKTLSNFEKYDTIKENKNLMLFSNFYLPIELTKITNYEYTIENVIYTEEELIEKVTNQLEQELYEKIDNKENITNKQINIYKNEGYIDVEVIYEVLENIGIEEKMVY